MKAHSLLVFLLLANSESARAQSVSPPVTVLVEKNLAATMRDGVVLRADVYRPDTPGRHSALLQRTPYSKNPTQENPAYRRLAEAGFVVVVQDTRGRYMSDGVAVPHDEGADGYDTVEWVAALPYVNGRVGMFGGSYSATTQLLAAPLRPPHLAALFPSASYASRYDMVFQGGAFYLADGLGWNLGQAVDARRRALQPTVSRDGEIGLTSDQRREFQDDWIWRLPMNAMSVLDVRRYSPGYFDMLAHPSFDAFWSTFDVAARHSKFEVPAYHLTGWYDALLNGTLHNFSGLRANAATPRARRNQRLIVGPWTHARPNAGTNAIGDVSFGPDAGFDSQGLMIRWFRHWLNDSSGVDFPGAPVRLFVMGENRWRDEQEWPLARARETSFHLASGGTANALDGNGRLSGGRPLASAKADSFTYNPAAPVPSGSSGAYSRAPLDQRATEQRRDVLVYTSEVMEAPLEVTGPVRLVLWASSSRRDTDFTAKLVDVFPDGTARALTDGIIRARYRASRTTPTLLTPGRAEEFVVEAGATSNVFLPGHRIRLEVSSSNFPRFDRNPNTGGTFAADTTLLPAQQTVLHDAAHPSRLVLPVVPRAVDRAPLGYTRTSGTTERALEQRFRAAVSADSISALHRPLSQRPHPAGSPGGVEVAAYLVKTLTSFGLEVETRDYMAWLSQPRSEQLTMTAPTRRELSLREPPIAEDPTSNHPELREAYIAYSASGAAAGQVVYVNYGLPADYAALAQLGVSARGHIVLARYGKSHRAVKVHEAQQAGATALILYSDPADDGVTRGPAFPDGYWRGEQMPQRGNAKLSWFFHGDPLTPGTAAVANALRLEPATAPTLPKIPVVVIGWGEARHLLAALGGTPAPAAFRGGVPVEYRVGPGPATVSLNVTHDDGLRPIRNVVATVRGSRQPNRVVMLGTHHDAWTFGGVDPGTGTASLLEVARVLGTLAKSGWRPARSISLAFWDAEEFGLIGSTEYAEELRRRLKEQLIMYVNTDMYMKGRLDPGGVPSLRDFVIDVAGDVPANGNSVLASWRQSAWERTAPELRTGSVADFIPELKNLGSGADFVPFQDHLGIPSLSMEFIGANGYGFGTYHSNYDSRAYVERIADPGFAQGVTMVSMLGTLALRMANADVVPFRFTPYAQSLVNALGSTTLGPRARIALTEATLLDDAITKALMRGTLTAARAGPVNDRLARLEQQLTDDAGSADTKWYRHVFYGWNIYSLYDGQPFPGLAEAERLRDDARVAHERARIAGALERMIVELRAARGLAQAR
ncbi:MAG: CocE/NonD family hydrolase [Gemmatimonadaceae bacterium]|nr:CocE/NonD family hydrolase [Gemmatimonadaceae bacterium]